MHNFCMLQIENEDWDKDEVLQRLRKDRGYTYEDCITCSPDKLPNYEEKVFKIFITVCTVHVCIYILLR